MFNLLHSSTNQEVFEKHLCNQGHYEMLFVMQRKPSHATTKSMLFTVSKDESMEHKGGHWQVLEDSIGRNVACQKAPLGQKQHQTVKKSSL